MLSCWLNRKTTQRLFTYQFKFLLLFVLQLFNVLRKVWSVKVVVQPSLDLQHFLGDAAEGLCYLMNQLPVVVEVILGPRPQVGLMSSGRQSAVKTPPRKTQAEMYEASNSDFYVKFSEIKITDPWRKCDCKSMCAQLYAVTNSVLSHY